MDNTLVVVVSLAAGCCWSSKAREARKHLTTELGLEPRQVRLERLSRKMVSVSLIKSGERTEVLSKEGVTSMPAEELLALVKSLL